VLDRIKTAGDIFWAESDRNWILDGANVHVSMIGLDDGTTKTHILDGEEVGEIYSDLTSAVNLTKVKKLRENRGLAFIGTQKGGPFNITAARAREMLDQPLNPIGRPNSDVVKPWANASTVTSRLRLGWIIDFGAKMAEAEAALYEKPFEYVVGNIRQKRLENEERDSSNVRWWIHQRPRPAMRAATKDLPRYIVTPRHSKHRVFLWLSAGVVPDSALIVFARSDDYFFGILQSRIHEVWTRRKGTQVREAESGFRYTPDSCFATFPFPWPPRSEQVNESLGAEMSEAARELVQRRDAWLNPPGTSERERLDRTLTNLYNNLPTWLVDAHRKLDEAVFAAYGWPPTLTRLRNPGVLA